MWQVIVFKFKVNSIKKMQFIEELHFFLQYLKHYFRYKDCDTQKGDPKSRKLNSLTHKMIFLIKSKFN